MVGEGNNVVHNGAMNEVEICVVEYFNNFRIVVLRAIEGGDCNQISEVIGQAESLIEFILENTSVENQAIPGILGAVLLLQSTASDASKLILEVTDEFNAINPSLETNSGQVAFEDLKEPVHKLIAKILSNNLQQKSMQVILQRLEDFLSREHQAMLTSGTMHTPPYAPKLLPLDALPRFNPIPDPQPSALSPQDEVMQKFHAIRDALKSKLTLKQLAKLAQQAYDLTEQIHSSGLQVDEDIFFQLVHIQTDAASYQAALKIECVISECKVVLHDATSAIELGNYGNLPSLLPSIEHALTLPELQGTELLAELEVIHSAAIALISESEANPVLSNPPAATTPSIPTVAELYQVALLARPIIEEHNRFCEDLAKMDLKNLHVLKLLIFRAEKTIEQIENLNLQSNMGEVLVTMESFLSHYQLEYNALMALQQNDGHDVLAAAGEHELPPLDYFDAINPHGVMGGFSC